MERDSAARGAIQRWLKILARSLQTGLGFSARPNGLENLKKSHVIETEFQPGLKSRKQYGCRWEAELSDFSGIKAIKERILFVVSLISKLGKSMRTSTADKVKQYDAVKKAMNSASSKYPGPRGFLFLRRELLIFFLFRFASLISK